MSSPTRPPITKTQTKILACIQDSIDKFGYPPTLREIGDAVGLKSISTVSYQLSILHAHGVVEFRNGSRRQPRAMKIAAAYRTPKPVKLTEKELAQLRGLGQGEVPAVVEKILNDRLNSQHN